MNVYHCDNELNLVFRGEPVELVNSVPEDISSALIEM